jgi:anti-sigma B factor antagonist
MVITMLTQLTFDDFSRVQLVEVIGRVDNDSTATLDQSVEEALASGRNQIILDLSGVQYMNSAGLRELVQLWKRVQKTGGTLIVANPSERVKRVLDLVGLETVFRIYSDPAWNSSLRSAANLPTSQRQTCYCS